MKTIAISIDEPTLKALDRLAEDHPSRAGSRSRLVRAALHRYIAGETRRQREEAEREILRKHRDRLARQAEALVAEQAGL